MTAVLKVEHDLEAEVCAVCGDGRGGELLTPEEHDESAPPMQLPLRAMLLHLNNNKVVPDGRMCTDCIRRAIEAYEFSSSLSSKGAPPLSEKIRALRRRLHELTQKIDVFIVVGGPGVNSGGVYNEDDIIMVERDALAAATAADDEDMERAKNIRGDTVYQCSVCPQTFQRVSEYRSHCAAHPAEALHSCWTCGAQFAARDALAAHQADHDDRAGAALVCHLCDTTFTSPAELRRHGEACAGACPLCGAWCGSRAALAAHAAAAHARSQPALCPACFRRLPGAPALAAHLLRHRQARHYVCGYDGCILRFPTRANLMSHIRKCHAAAPPAAPAPAPAPAGPAACPHCSRTFGSVAAMRRHARVHNKQEELGVGAGPGAGAEAGAGAGGDVMDAGEGEVEYLEVDALDDPDYRH